MPVTGTKIDPAAWYDDASVYAALEVGYQTLARARREGSLRFSRKGGRVFYLGQWIIDWLMGNPVTAAGGEALRA